MQIWIISEKRNLLDSYVHSKDIRRTILVGPTVTGPVQDPVAVKNLDNRLNMPSHNLFIWIPNLFLTHFIVILTFVLWMICLVLLFS